MGKLDCKFDELDKLECKFDNLAKLYCKFDELAKLECKFDELDKLRMSWISCTVSWFVCLFDLILYVHSTIFQLCGTGLPGLNQY